MRRVIPLISVCFVLAAAVESAFAQQRLFVQTPKEIVEVETSLSSLGRITRRVPVSSNVTVSSGPGPVAVAGGTLLAWPVESKLGLFDTRTGAFRQYAFPFFVGEILGASADSFTVLVRARTFTSDHVGFIDVRHQTVRLLDLGAKANRVVYAPKSDLLFVSRLVGASPSDIEVRRAADGTLLKTVSIAPAETAWDIAVDASGTRLFVFGGPGTGLLALDVASGSLLARNSAYPSFPHPLLIDEHRRRLLVPVGLSSTPFIAALSIDTLQLIGVATLPEVTIPRSEELAYFSAVQANVSDKSATLFAVETVLAEPGWSNPLPPVCKPSALVALNVDTGQLRRGVDLTAVTGDANCYVRLVRLTEPGAPASFSANATGNRVALTWAPEAATHYELEAGTAPGLANLATISVNDTQLVVDGVPPGVYHLRVRAINTIGKSAPSQDVRLVVQ